MKSSKFIQLAERILESKQKSVIRQILESNARTKRLRKEAMGDVIPDEEDETLDEEDGAGNTAAARKADDPDKAQADLGKADDDQLHEEDEGQLGLDNFEVDERDGDDLVATTESAEDDFLGDEELDQMSEELDDDGVEMDADGKPVVESSDEDEDDLDQFLDEEDDCEEDEEELSEARRRKMAKNKVKKKK